MISEIDVQEEIRAGNFKFDLEDNFCHYQTPTEPYTWCGLPAHALGPGWCSDKVLTTGPDDAGMCPDCGKAICPTCHALWLAEVNALRR